MGFLSTGPIVLDRSITKVTLKRPLSSKGAYLDTRSKASSPDSYTSVLEQWFYMLPSVNKCDYSCGISWCIKWNLIHFYIQISTFKGFFDVFQEYLSLEKAQFLIASIQKVLQDIKKSFEMLIWIE